MGCAASTDTEADSKPADGDEAPAKQQRATTPERVTVEKAGPSDDDTDEASAAPAATGGPSSLPVAAGPKGQERATLSKPSSSTSMASVPDQGLAPPDDDDGLHLLSPDPTSMDHYNSTTFNIRDDDPYYDSAKEVKVVNSSGANSPKVSSLRGSMVATSGRQSPAVVHAPDVLSESSESSRRRVGFRLAGGGGDDEGGKSPGPGSPLSSDAAFEDDGNPLRFAEVPSAAAYDRDATSLDVAAAS